LKLGKKKKMRTEIFEAKLRATKNERFAGILTDASYYTKCIEQGAEQVSKIFYTLESMLSEPEQELIKINISPYGGEVNISGVESETTFDSVLLALTELYKEGEKFADYDKIGYRFVSKDDKGHIGIYITLQIDPTVTGCEIVYENVTIPERVYSEHTERKLVIKCNK
jgi:hypothetical protein